VGYASGLETQPESPFKVQLWLKRGFESSISHLSEDSSKAQAGKMSKEPDITKDSSKD